MLTLASDTLRIAALAGGVGGARLADGLQEALEAGALSVIVNTGDDFKLWGLHISPDLDTVMYTLAGLADPVQGWGLERDTWMTLEMVERYGRDPWFRLGDMDLATHILRTQMLNEGRSITEATGDLAAALGVPSHILPMCNEEVQTKVSTPDGMLDFQEYFVRRRHADPVTGISYQYSLVPQMTPQVGLAIEEAGAIVLCPSNPFVSIDPILQVEGMRAALARSSAPIVAVSPIVGGAAVKGPAADMMRSLGHEVSPVGVARLYRGLVDGMVIDTVDGALAPRIRDLGMEVEVTRTVMKDRAGRQALAADVMNFCRRLGPAKERAQA